MDSDDWVSVDIYEKLFACALMNDADIVNCDYYEYRGEDNIKKYIKYKELTFNMLKEIANKEFILDFLPHVITYIEKLYLVIMRFGFQSRYFGKTLL